MSSTSVDLASWREEVNDVLRDVGLDVLSMEAFPAMASGAQLGSTSMVERCDVFVGLYARRYGTLAEDGRSVTEHEYAIARRRKMPRLCFLLRDDAEWPPDVTESEPGASALVRLKKQIRGDVIVAEFTDLSDLKTKVRSAADEYLGRETRRRRIRVLIFLLILAALIAAAFTMKPQVRVEHTTREIALSGGFVMSPDHRVVGFRGKDAALWPVERAFERRIRFLATFADFVFSPKSRYVAVHDGRGSVFLCSRDGGYALPDKPVLSGLTLDGYDGKWAVFSPDETFVAVWATDGRVYVWDVTSSSPDAGRPFARIRVTSNTAGAIEPDLFFSRSSRWLGIVDGEGVVYVAKPDGTSVASPLAFRSVPDPERSALRPRLWFSDDEQWVAVADVNGRVAVWRAGDTPLPVSADPSRSIAHWAERAAFTRDNQWIIIRPPYRGFYRRRADAPAGLPLLPIVEMPRGVGEFGGDVLWFSDDGRWAAGSTPDQSLYVWSANDPKAQRRAVQKDWPHLVSFSPGSEWISAVVDSGRFYVWKPGEAPGVPAVRYSRYFGTGTVWCEDGRHYFTYGDHNLFFGAADGVTELIHQGVEDVQAITVVPDASALLVLTLERKFLRFSSKDDEFRVDHTLHLATLSRKLCLWGMAVREIGWPRLAPETRRDAP